MSEKETGLVERLNKNREWLARDGFDITAKSLKLAADTIERLQAELAECQIALSVMRCSPTMQTLRDLVQSEIMQQNTALALRVKALESALEKYGKHDRNCEAVTEAVSECCGCGLGDALSTSDRTSEEVIAEFLGEPVAEVMVGVTCHAFIVWAD